VRKSVRLLLAGSMVIHVTPASLYASSCGPTAEQNAIAVSAGQKRGLKRYERDIGRTATQLHTRLIH